MKLDILVLASHPDDAEISCAGTILSHIAQGKQVGVVDLTRGEMGTRGTPEIRLEEAMAASRIMGLAVRENMGFRDGFFKNDEKHQLEIIRIVRKYRPEIVLANAITDRHTDHGNAAILAKDACFLSGLSKIKTRLDDKEQEAWRPKAIYHYIQNNFIKPDIVVDITGLWDKKLEAIKAFKSQFFDPENDEPETFISQPGFLDFLHSRAREFGHSIGVKYGEGFTVNHQMGIKSLFNLM
jgi:N-acetylglucosamine malate deacetylase 1